MCCCSTTSTKPIPMYPHACCRCCCCSVFKNLGLNCSNWTAPVYNDLTSQGGRHERKDECCSSSILLLTTVFYKLTACCCCCCCSAFKDLGVDCSNWTAPVYNDLMSQGDGTGEGMVRTFFSRVGWPTFLPTKEEDLFTRKVHQLKQEQLKKLIKKRKVPPRQDVDKVGVTSCFHFGDNAAMLV